MAAEMTVWERQRAQLKWQWQQQQSFLNNNTNNNVYSLNHPLPFSQTQHLLPTISLPSNITGRQCPDLASLCSDRWPDLSHYSMFGNACLNQVNCLPRTSSCPPEVEEVQSEKAKAVTYTAVLTGRGIGNESCRSSLKKRKAETAQIPKQQETDIVATEDDNSTRNKRIKVDADLQLKDDINNNNGKKTETSGTTTKENSKLSEGSKSDYIHVRARRGQATDNHSLAERVRREKISERMRYLQDLVPGCNKITGKAGMLDEIINYVQSLQKQVEFLSMKLAAVNPRIDLNIDNILDKEMIPVCNGSVSAFGISSELADQSYIPYEQVVACCGLDFSANSPEKSCFNVHQPSAVWDTDLHSICNVEFNPAGSASTFQFQPLQGTLEDNDFKGAM